MNERPTTLKACSEMLAQATADMLANMPAQVNGVDYYEFGNAKLSRIRSRRDVLVTLLDKFAQHEIDQLGYVND